MSFNFFQSPTWRETCRKPADENISVMQLNAENVTITYTVEAVVSGHPRGGEKDVHNWSWPLTRMVLFCFDLFCWDNSQERLSGHASNTSSEYKWNVRCW